MTACDGLPISVIMRDQMENNGQEYGQGFVLCVEDYVYYYYWHIKYKIAHHCQ